MDGWINILNIRLPYRHLIFASFLAAYIAVSAYFTRVPASSVCSGYSATPILAEIWPTPHFRFRQQHRQIRRHLFRRADLAGAGQDQGKLVSTHAGDSIAVAHSAVQPVGTK